MSAATTIPGFELESLLAPISAEGPSGTDLAKEPGIPLTKLADQMDACAQLDERSARQQAAKAVIGKGLELLRVSKDLTAAALVVRGLLVAYNFPGLAVGLRLLRGLHETFWPSLFPGPLPEATPETESELRAVLGLRRRPLQRLMDPLCQAAALVPVTPPLDPSEPDYSFFRWQVAHEKDAAVSAERLQEAARKAPEEHFRTLHAALSSCIAECSELTTLCDALYRRDAIPDEQEAVEPPQFGRLRNELVLYLELVERQLERGQKPARPAAGSAASGPSSRGALAPAVLPELAASPPRYVIRSRAHALSCLTGAARFLHQHEPLSPLPYLVARAVRWGSLLSIREWIEELARQAEAPPVGLLHALGLGFDQELTEPAAVASPARRGSFFGLFKSVDEKNSEASACDDARDPEALGSRADALALISDATRYLYELEPLSPLPHHLHRVLAMARGSTPFVWLDELMPQADQKLLEHLRKTLGYQEPKTPSGS